MVIHVTFLVGEVASSDGPLSSDNDEDIGTKCVFKCSCVHNVIHYTPCNILPTSQSVKHEIMFNFLCL